MIGETIRVFSEGAISCQPEEPTEWDDSSVEIEVANYGDLIRTQDGTRAAGPGSP